MANHKSAIKRARQNEIRRQRNKGVKTRCKSVTKEIRMAVAAGNIDEAAQKLPTAASAFDTAARKGVVHKRTAARKVSRLTKLVGAQG